MTEPADDFERINKINSQKFIEVIRNAVKEATAAHSKGAKEAGEAWEKVYDLIAQRAKEKGSDINSVVSGMTKLLGLTQDRSKELAKHMAEALTATDRLKEPIKEITEGMRSLNQATGEWLHGLREIRNFRSLDVMRDRLREMKNLAAGLQDIFSGTDITLKEGQTPYSAFGPQLSRIQELVGRTVTDYDVEGLTRLTALLNEAIITEERLVTGRERIAARASSAVETGSLDLVSTSRNYQLIRDTITLLAQRREIEESNLVDINKGTAAYTRQLDLVKRLKLEIINLRAAAAEEEKRRFSGTSVSRISIPFSSLVAPSPEELFNRAIQHMAEEFNLGNVRNIIEPDPKLVNDLAIMFGRDLDDYESQLLEQLGHQIQVPIQQDLNGFPMVGRIDAIVPPEHYKIPSMEKEVVVDFKVMARVIDTYVDDLRKGVISVADMFNRGGAALRALKYVAQIAGYAMIRNQEAYLLAFRGLADTNPATNEAYTPQESARAGPRAIIPIATRNASGGLDTLISREEIAKFQQAYQDAIVKAIQSRAAGSVISQLQEAPVALIERQRADKIREEDSRRANEEAVRQAAIQAEQAQFTAARLYDAANAQKQLTASAAEQVTHVQKAANSYDKIVSQVREFKNRVPGATDDQALKSILGGKPEAFQVEGRRQFQQSIVDKAHEEALALNKLYDEMIRQQRLLSSGLGGGTPPPPPPPPNTPFGWPGDDGGDDKRRSTNQSLHEQLAAARELLLTQRQAVETEQAKARAAKEYLNEVRQQKAELGSDPSAGQLRAIQNNAVRARTTHSAAQSKIPALKAEHDATAKLITEIEKLIAVDAARAALDNSTNKVAPLRERLDALKAEASQIEKGSEAHRNLQARIKQLQTDLKQLLAEQEAALRAGKLQEQQDRLGADAAQAHANALAEKASVLRITAEQKSIRNEGAIAQEVARAAEEEAIAAQNVASVKREHADATVLLNRVQQAQTAETRAAIKDTNNLKTEMGSASKATQSWAERLFSLQRVATVFFGTLLSSIAFNSLQAIQNAFRGAVEFAKEFEVSLVQLAVAIRSSQRLYGASAGSIEEWMGAVRALREEFEFLSTKDISAGFATLINQSRELALSADQIRNLTDAAAVLAATNPGKTYQQAAESIGRAVAGQARALYDFNVLITDIARDSQSLQMFGEVYDDLDKGQRVLVDYQLILNEVALRQEDVGLVAQTAAQRIEAANISIQENTAGVGKVWNEVWAKNIEVLAFFLNYFLDYFMPAFVAGAEIFIRTSQFMGSGALFWAKVVTNAFDLAKKSPQDFMDTVRQYANESESAMQQNSDRIRGDLGLIGSGFENVGQSARKAASDIEAAGVSAEAAIAKLKDLMAEFAAAEQSINLDYVNSLQELKRDRVEQEADLEEQYQQDIIDAKNQFIIDQHRLAQEEADAIGGGVDKKSKLLDDLRKAEEDYLLAVARAYEDYQIRRAQLFADYNSKEQEAERDHQRRLQKIQEDAYFRLEDAVRAQDARQVLLALRDKNRAVNDEKRRYQDEKEDRAKALAERVEQLDAAYALDAKRREEDYQRRLKEIEENAAKQSAASGRARKKEEEKGMTSLAAQLTALKKKHEADKEEIGRGFEKRAKELNRRRQNELVEQKRDQAKQVAAFGDMWKSKYGVQNAWLNTIYARLVAYFGANGFTMQLFRQYIEQLKRLAPNEAPGIPKPTARGTGGTLQAGVPTLVNENASTRPEVIVSSANGFVLTRQDAQNALANANGGGLTKTQMDVNISIKADEHFSVDFEDRILGVVAEVFERQVS